ncbi:MAG: hypothetical protein AB8I08_22115 [Sandaracinaceae bacterium]
MRGRPIPGGGGGTERLVGGRTLGARWLAVTGRVEGSGGAAREPGEVGGGGGRLGVGGRLSAGGFWAGRGAGLTAVPVGRDTAASPPRVGEGGADALGGAAGAGARGGALARGGVLARGGDGRGGGMLGVAWLGVDLPEAPGGGGMSTPVIVGTATSSSSSPSSISTLSSGLGPVGCGPVGSESSSISTSMVESDRLFWVSSAMPVGDDTTPKACHASAAARPAKRARPRLGGAWGAR